MGRNTIPVLNQFPILPFATDLFTFEKKGHIMSKAEFEYLVSQLKQGNNQPLQQLTAYKEDCIGMLRNRSNGSCRRDDAEDIFIDAVMAFRRNVLQGKAVFQNVKGYLATICWNKWLESSRAKQRHFKKQEEVERQLYVVKEEPVDHLVLEEERKAEQTQKNQRFQLITTAMAKLSEKCQQILKLAIIEELPMKEIAQIMGFASANVAKTTKSRCYNRLIKSVKAAS